MPRTKWFDRTFSNDNPNSAYIEILHRLKNTPERLEKLVQRTSSEIMTHHTKGKWSAQEQIGHLLDLEPLWSVRVDDIKEGDSDLTEADLTNRKTHEANHNAKQIANLLDEFRKARTELLAKFDSATAAEKEHSATHPRLGTKMRLVDLAYFVAEHDDHHLGEIAKLVG